VILALLLAGVYAQDCADRVRRFQSFEENRAAYSEANFFDEGCTRPAVLSRSYGIYSLPEGEGVRNLDFTFTKVSLVPLTEEVAADYRKRMLCGLSVWEMNRETEITGRHCDFLGLGAQIRVPQRGEVRYGIVKQEEDSLYFGRLSPAFDGTNPESRPRFLDPRPYRRIGNLK
jgi:hypothetical protein